MSFKAKHELLLQVVPRYREATRSQKSMILDEFVAATGYSRKYALRLLANPPPLKEMIRRPRGRRYGPDVQASLASAWAAANFICAKRLVPFLPELVEALERHGHLVLSADVRSELLSVSAATADRILQPLRVDPQAKKRVVSSNSSLLRHRVPIRTSGDWDGVGPGYVEIDLVGHGGSRSDGPFLRTLVVTDIATAWTECVALGNGSREAVSHGLDVARRLMPFPMLGIDTDNGPEFINEVVVEYCEQATIEFTRGRPYRKNDQCFVEQKNGAVVREFVGYARYEGLQSQQQMMELYRALRLYSNFFQPSMKLLSKERRGSHTHRQYDAAQTPLRRLIVSDVLAPSDVDTLNGTFAALDPIRLLSQLRHLQDALWRRTVAVDPTSLDDPVADVKNEIARFHPDGCMASDGVRVDASDPIQPDAAASRKRHYRKTGRSIGPRLYRTRKDPLADVNDELRALFQEDPTITANSLLRKIQAKHPEAYPANLLRTLQRRLTVWRAEMILTVEETWITEDEPLTRSHSVALRAVMASDAPIDDSSSHPAKEVDEHAD